MLHAPWFMIFNVSLLCFIMLTHISFIRSANRAMIHHIKSQIIIFHFAGEMTSDFFRIVNEARSHSLGPFSPSFNIQTCLLEGMSRHLPEDAHLRVNGKLHISLTRVYDGKSVIVSQFNSREDLLDALMCACFIPGFSGIFPPKFHGVRK